MFKVLVVDNDFFNEGRFADLLPEAELSIISTGLLPHLDQEVVNQFDLIILTGGMLDPTDKTIFESPGVRAELELIRRAQKPIIGICYGHQLIARAFDCRIEQNPPLERFCCIRVTDTRFLPNESLVVWENHSYSVTEVSRDIESLAVYEPLGSKELIRHRTLPIWGLQFHPEREPDKQQGKQVFDKILEILELK